MVARLTNTSSLAQSEFRPLNSRQRFALSDFPQSENIVFSVVNYCFSRFFQYRTASIVCYHNDNYVTEFLIMILLLVLEIKKTSFIFFFKVLNLQQINISSDCSDKTFQILKKKNWVSQK